MPTQKINEKTVQDKIMESLIICCKHDERQLSTIYDHTPKLEPSKILVQTDWKRIKPKKQN